VTGDGAGISGIGGAKGILSGGRASDARSHARAPVGAAEGFGIERNGVYQREECDSHRPGVCRSAKELRRAAFLGAWILGTTVGKNEAAVHRYIQEQEKGDQRLEQLEMGFCKVRFWKAALLTPHDNK
jgi:hypothetical protein